ncbi:hypothetical protein EF294_20385 [Gordonia oryzae]|uniref:Uncharacterized protein n=1 Tax=Gordonia oryzae TaxID=2487349 RepID=A0A3N4GVC7_9ACTN|nr:hypothetical protein EF294_20385 [Gordonia oryzae]
MFDMVTVECLTGGVANVIDVVVAGRRAGVNGSRVVSGSQRRYPLTRMCTTGSTSTSPRSATRHLASDTPRNADPDP